MTFVPNQRNVDEFRITKDKGFFGITKPVTVRVPDTSAQTAANFTAPFFIAERPYRVIGIVERHEAAGSDGGAVTLQVNKVPSGTAPASGTALLSTAFNLKATADTNQTGSLVTTVGVLSLDTGDALSLISSGTLTSLKGVTVAVTLRSI